MGHRAGVPGGSETVTFFEKGVCPVVVDTKSGSTTLPKKQHFSGDLLVLNSNC